MIDNKTVLKKFLLRGVRKLLRLIFDYLPITVNKFFAEKGYTYFISRKKNYNYVAKIYSSNFKSSRRAERECSLDTCEDLENINNQGWLLIYGSLKY